MIRLNFGQRCSQPLRRFVLGLALLNFTYPSPAAKAATSSVVDAPCTTTGQIGLRSCDEFLDRGTDGTPGLFAQLHQTIERQISAPAPTKGYYQHVDPGYDALTQTDTSRFFGPTLCNLIQGEFTLVPETAFNRLRESCGAPIKIQISYNRTNILGCQTTSSPVPIIIHKEYNAANPNGSPGTLEDGYLRGSIVQATTCFYQQATKEIRDQHRLSVNDINGNPSACKAILTDYQSTAGQYRNSVDNFKSKISGQANIADIVNCKKGWDTQLSNRPDVGALRQSAQLLCAARAAMESMFTHLAACEIFARSQAGYFNVVASSASQKAFIATVQKDLSNQCSKTCGADNIGACNVPPASSMESCANTCYKDQMPKVFKNFINGHWKSDGSKCDLSMNSTAFWAIGMLGWARGRRNRKNQGRRGTKHKLVLGLLSFFGACAAACSGGQHTAPQGPCDPAKTSCVTEAPICDSNPEAPQCSRPDPGAGGVESQLADAAQAGNTANGAIKSANKLISDAPTTSTESTLAQVQAASVGGLADGPKTAEGNSSGSGHANFPTTNAQNSRGPQGGAVGGGSMGLNASLKTSAMPDEVQPSGIPQDNGGGSYKVGTPGSADSGSGTGLFGAGNFVPSNGDGSGANGSEETITPDMNGTSAQVATLEDPEDYFTRLGLDENLFKVVERRYRKTSTAWVGDGRGLLR